MTCKSAAQSAADLAMGPVTSEVKENGITPAVLTSPKVGFTALRPINAAGPRMLPRVSVPRVAGTIRAASAMPLPLLDPAGREGRAPGVDSPYTAGELTAVQMAEQDHPGGSQAAPRGRVGLGHVAFQDGAVGRQRQSGRRDHVLERDRQSGERPGRAARADLVSPQRRLRRLSLIDADERAELPVPVRDAFQACSGEFPRRDLPAFSAAAASSRSRSAGWVVVITTSSLRPRLRCHEGRRCSRFRTAGAARSRRCPSQLELPYCWRPSAPGKPTM